MQDLREEPPFVDHALSAAAVVAYWRQGQPATLGDVDRLTARVDELQQALIHQGNRFVPVADFVARTPAEAIRTVTQHWLDTATDVPLETRRQVYARMVEWLDGLPL